jgi:hypothetical protein
LQLFRCVCRIALIGAALAGLALSSMASSALASSYDQTHGSQNTSLMQQMDHQRRVNEEHRAQAERQESQALVEAEQAGTGSDYALLAVLASSGLVFFVICRRRGGSVRRCLSPRRPRFEPPSRN